MRLRRLAHGEVHQEADLSAEHQSCWRESGGLIFGRAVSHQHVWDPHIPVVLVFTAVFGQLMDDGGIEHHHAVALRPQGEGGDSCESR